MSTIPSTGRERCQDCGREDRSLAVNKKNQAFMIYVSRGLCQVCQLSHTRKRPKPTSRREGAEEPAKPAT
jgi:hypothetical protein